MNNLSVSGNLTKDCELKDVGGHTVLNFSLADNIFVNGKQEVNYFTCSLWGQRGKTLSQYLKKGQKVFVTGKLSTFTTTEGKMYLKVDANDIELLGGSRQQEQKRS